MHQSWFVYFHAFCFKYSKYNFIIIMISFLFFGQDRLAAFQLLATMYIKYIQIFRKMEQCYDQIVHPQKRRVLRHVLDGTMGRILELKHEMVNLEFSEYHYFDDVLSDLKLTPVSGFKKYIYMGFAKSYCCLHETVIQNISFKRVHEFQNIPIN